MTDELGKIPPNARDIEGAVLGALMLSPDIIDSLSLFLKPEMFYVEGNGKIYQSILNLYYKHQPVDILTVTQQLVKDNQLSEVGGASYISTLTANIASGMHAEFHARIVQEKFIRRELIRLSHEIGNNSYDDSIDLEDIISNLNIGLESIHENIYSGVVAKSFGENVKQSLDEYFSRETMFRNNEVPGIPTPVKDIDRMTGGWNDGELVIIAGRPGMGKTAFALSAVRHAVEHEKWVNIYSLEMSAVRLVDRMLCGVSGINAEKYRDGALSNEEHEKISYTAKEMMNYKVMIDPKPVVTMNYILSNSRILKKKGKCDMIIIDYLQLVDEENKHGRNREQAVSEISRKSKLIAKELDVPVLMLAQLNRSCELRGGDKRPWLADLRESGSIEQDADIVGFLYREERYDKSAERGKGEFIIAKQRNGRVGTVYFGYNQELTKIFDYVERNSDIEPQFNPDARIETEKWKEFDDHENMPF